MSMRIALTPEEERAVSIIGICAIFEGAADLVASFPYHSLEKELTA